MGSVPWSAFSVVSKLARMPALPIDSGITPDREFSPRLMSTEYDTVGKAGMVPEIRFDATRNEMGSGDDSVPDTALLSALKLSIPGLKTHGGRVPLIPLRPRLMYFSVVGGVRAGMGPENELFERLITDN